MESDKFPRIANKYSSVAAQLVEMLAGNTDVSQGTVEALTASMGLMPDQSTEIILWLTQQQQKRRVLLDLLRDIVDRLVLAHVPRGADGWPIVTDNNVRDA